MVLYMRFLSSSLPHVAIDSWIAWSMLSPVSLCSISSSASRIMGVSRPVVLMLTLPIEKPAALIASRFVSNLTVGKWVRMCDVMGARVVNALSPRTQPSQ
jgi:hypothetical protein